MADLKMNMTEEGNWEVSDYTSSDDNYNTYFKSLWDMEYNFISLKCDRSDAKYILEDPKHYEHRKCKMAINRHQKFLLQQTGVIETPEAIKPKHMFLLQKRAYGHHNPVARITMQEVVETAKQLKARYGNINKYDASYIEVTPENQELVEEYNQAIDIFLDALRGMEDEIFGTRCTACNEFAHKHKYLITSADWPEKQQRWQREPKKLCCDVCYKHYIKKNEIEPKDHHLVT